MAHSIATHGHIDEELAVQNVSNPLANIWLGVLGFCLGCTLICTVVLLAWPIVAQMAAG